MYKWSDNCFDTSGYVRSLFVLDSPINALSDSYPVTWLNKVVALLPPVADSLALYGLCVILVIDFIMSNNVEN
jgi:hypothetical protein